MSGGFGRLTRVGRLAAGLAVALLPAALAPARAGGLPGPIEPDTIYAGSHALVIGVSDYSETGWESLPGVLDDVAGVTALLQRSGFAVEQVRPPRSRARIMADVERFFETHGAERENRLLVYYAGHGTTLRDRNDQLTGFIVPNDAPVPAPQSRAEAFGSGIPMTWLEQVASGDRVKAKHVLFVFDSCFSGSIFQRRRGAGERPAVIDYFARQEVRQFISSGTHTQEVPDESVFFRMFQEALAGRGDANADGYITGTELGQFLRGTVSNITRARQTPQFARMSASGIDYGEFLFFSPIGPRVSDAAEAVAGLEEPLGGPGERFRNCRQCPEMIGLPAGSALVGSPLGEGERDDAEPLPEIVRLGGGFAMSVHEVSSQEWNACFRAGGCSRWVPLPEDGSTRPVAGVSWEDAREYTLWLSEVTGHAYRLPTEREWEYAARAGSISARPWGDEIGVNRANCRRCGSRFDGRSTSPAGSFEANGFGLHDMLGNVWEWVRDCEAVAADEASGYACYLKGGSFATAPVSVRSAARGLYPARRAQANFGFRVLREPLPR